MDDIMEYFRLATSAGKIIRCFEILRKIAIVFGMTATLLGTVKTILMLKTQSQKKHFSS